MTASEIEPERHGAQRFGPLSVALAALLGLALVAVGLVAAIALRESEEAGAQRDIAASRALAAAALQNLDRSPDLAMLLSLEAYRRVHGQSAAQSYEARHSLSSTLQRHPRLVGVLEVDDAGAAAVSFSGDGRRLAASSGDGATRAWDLVSRSPVGKPMRGGYSCYSPPADVDVRFAPGGETLAHTSCGAATVFEVEHGRSVRRAGGASDALGEEETDAVLSPDGGLLALYGEYTGFRLLDLTTGKRVRRGFGKRHDQLFPVAFSGDGRALAGYTAFTDAPVRVWEVESGAPLGKPLPGRFLALAPTGSIAAVLEDGKVTLWDVVRATAVGKPFAVESLLGIEFDRTGKRLAVSTDDGLVRVWQFAPRTRRTRELARLNHDGALGLRFSPDGRTLATAGLDGAVRLWDVARPRALAARIHSAVPGEVAFSPDGRWLAANGDSGMVLWSVAKGGIVGTPRVVDRGIGLDIEFSPDGRTIASAFQEPGAIGLWDVASGRSRSLPTHEYWTQTVAYSPDGRLLASAFDGAKFWDPSTGVEVSPRLRGAFDSIAFSPDGRLVVTWQSPEYPTDVFTAIKLWGVSDRLPVGELPTTVANDLAFSPDGRTLAVAGYDGSVGFWDVTRRTLIHSLRAHTATGLLGSAQISDATSVAFSPDGRMLASVGRAGGMRLWDMTRVAPLGDPLRGYDNDFWDVAFSPDGQMLVSAGDDGTLLWDAVLLSRDLEEWRSRLCGIASRNLTVLEWRRFLPDEPYRKTCPQFR